ncbi:hypothetical protein Ancab_029497 [Ancistrocladus abbreviatus]
MMHTKSESDIASLAPSGPSSPSRSPKRPIYYVQSPSRDSHDGDKSSSLQATPMYNSPMESPSHPSFGRHSRNSSASRFSGIFRSSSGRKGGRKRSSGNNEKGWPECNVIMEEGSYDGLEDKGLSRRVQVLIGISSFVLLFTVFCLIIWGASRPYKAEVSVKSLTVTDFIVQEGTDFSGVPTKMVTVNGSLRISVYNPATFFGIHVSSTPINLLYSKITVATGQLQKHYQPRKSRRIVSALLEGTKVPLYGAGSSLTVSGNTAIGSQQVPFTLEFEINSRGYVVGKLVRTKHREHVSCSLMVDYTSTKPIKFNKDSCSYS